MCTFASRVVFGYQNHSYIASTVSVLALQLQKCLLFSAAVGSIKLILEKYYACATFSQCHNNNSQLNFTQHLRINHLELWAHLWNYRKFTPKENNPLAIWYLKQLVGENLVNLKPNKRICTVWLALGVYKQLHDWGGTWPLSTTCVIIV